MAQTKLCNWSEWRSTKGNTVYTKNLFKFLVMFESAFLFNLGHAINLLGVVIWTVALIEI